MPQNIDPLQFTELLITFSFDFQSVGEFCSLGQLIIQTVIDSVKNGYFYDFIHLE